MKNSGSNNARSEQRHSKGFFDSTKQGDPPHCGVGAVLLIKITIASSNIYKFYLYLLYHVYHIPINHKHEKLWNSQ